jgi:hypothetical protein
MTEGKARPPADRIERALIDDVLPTFDVSEYHETLVRAPTANAYAAVRGVDLARSRITLLLLAMRGIVALAQPRRARQLYGPLIRHPSLTLEDIQRAGFVTLGEEPGREIVLGVVGKFWKPGSGIERIQAQEFAAWDRPGFGKGVLNFAVRGAEGGSIVSTETRVQCTDAAARRSFRRYWRLIGPFSGLIRQRALALIKAEAERGANRR